MVHRRGSIQWRSVAADIAWRLLGLLAMAVCVTGAVFLLTVAFVALI